MQHRELRRRQQYPRDSHQLLLAEAQQVVPVALHIQAADALEHGTEPQRGERGDDLGIAEHTLVGGHVRHVVLQVRGPGHTLSGDAQQDLIRVVPGVPACVVRRRRQSAIRAALSPVRLALQPCAVARRAVLRVHLGAERDLLGIARIGLLAASCKEEREAKGRKA